MPSTVLYFLFLCFFAGKTNGWISYSKATDSSVRTVRDDMSLKETVEEVEMKEIELLSEFFQLMESQRETEGTDSSGREYC